MNIINYIHQQREKEKTSEEEFRKTFQDFYCDKIIENIGEFRRAGVPMTQEAYEQFVENHPSWLKHVPYNIFESINALLDNFATEREALNNQAIANGDRKNIKDLEDQVSLLRFDFRRECRPFTDQALLLRMVKDIESPICNEVDRRDYEFLLALGCDENTKMSKLLRENLKLHQHIKGKTVQRDGYDEGIDRITALLVLKKVYDRAKLKKSRVIPLWEVESTLRDNSIENVRYLMQKNLGRLTRDEQESLSLSIGTALIENAKRRVEKTKGFINACYSKREFLRSFVISPEVIGSNPNADAKQVDGKQVKKDISRGIIPDYRDSLHKIMLSRQDRPEDVALLRSGYELYWENLRLTKDLAFSKELTKKLFDNHYVYECADKENYYRNPFELVDNLVALIPALFVEGRSKYEDILIGNFGNMAPKVRSGTCGIKGFPKTKKLPTYKWVLEKCDEEAEKRAEIKRQERKTKKEEKKARKALMSGELSDFIEEVEIDSSQLKINGNQMPGKTFYPARGIVYGTPNSRRSTEVIDIPGFEEVKKEQDHNPIDEPNVTTPRKQHSKPKETQQKNTNSDMEFD